MTVNSFSLLMSVYAGDDAAHLDAALYSVERNTIRPAEIILVQDGPLTSTLMDAIERHSTTLNIKTIRLIENQGLGIALAAGLTNCSYSWVARFDADDICMPNRFEKQLQYINEHPCVDVFSSPVIEFETSIDEASLFRPVETEHEQIIELAKRRNPFNHMAIMFRKKAVIDAGSYQQDHLYEDYCLWVRMILNGAVTGNMTGPTVFARAGRSMFARRGGWRYIASEIRAQKNFFRWGFISRPQLMRNLILRIPVRLLPSHTRSVVYAKWLRTPI